MKSAVAILVLPIALAGCAAIIDGSSQTLSVKTMSAGLDVSGAQCTLTNNKGEWYVTTPGTVTVHRSYDALNVKCHKDGYTANIGSVPSVTKDMELGNIFFGGLIGAAVDMGTGDAYDYPSPITVNIQPAAISDPKHTPES